MPAAKLIGRRGGCFTWRLRVRPTPASEVYTVNVSYKTGSLPDVRVIDPVLSSPWADRQIPHMYEQERLCLFYPAAREWRADQTIVATIVPWTVTWLFFHEIWCMTGEWRGGGIDHEPRMPVRSRALLDF